MVFGQVQNSNGKPDLFCRQSWLGFTPTDPSPQWLLRRNKCVSRALAATRAQWAERAGEEHHPWAAPAGRTWAMVNLGCFYFGCSNRLSPPPFRVWKPSSNSPYLWLFAGKMLGLNCRVGGRLLEFRDYFRTRTTGCKLLVNVFWLGSDRRILTIKTKRFWNSVWAGAVADNHLFLNKNNWMGCTILLWWIHEDRVTIKGAISTYFHCPFLLCFTWMSLHVCKPAFHLLNSLITCWCGAKERYRSNQHRQGTSNIPIHSPEVLVWYLWMKIRRFLNMSC